MKRVLPLVLALAAWLGATAQAQAQARDTQTMYPEGTPVVVVGEISSQPRDAGVVVENKMQVAVGPERTDYTLHISNAALRGMDGREIAKSDLVDKTWVRAVGYVMDDPRRIDVQQLQVIGRDQAELSRSRYFRPDFAQGYVLATGEPTRTNIYPQGTPVAVVGWISSPPAGEIDEQKMQVAVGPAQVDYTLHFSDAELYNTQGNKVDEDALDDRQWVRAEGVVMDDPRRIKVSRVQILGTQPESYTRSAFYRVGHPQGYVMQTTLTQAAATPVSLTPQTEVVVLGEISSTPKTWIGEQKMQVAIGPMKTDYTLHFRGAQLYDENGQRIEADDLDGGEWVRAEGSVMNDPRRIRVTRVQVVGRDMPSLQRSAFYRPGLEQGYIMSVTSQVAGMRQVFPNAGTGQPLAVPVVVVGRVSDDTGALETTRSIQVEAAGNEWTLYVPEETTVLSAAGEPISVHELAEDQWIRATGWQTDDLRLRVERIENIGPRSAYIRSTVYRTSSPQGYVERIGEDRLQTRTLSGTITQVNRDRGYVVVQDEQGREHRFYMGEAGFETDGRIMDWTQLRTGDRVTVRSQTLRY